MSKAFFFLVAVLSISACTTQHLDSVSVDREASKALASSQCCDAEIVETEGGGSKNDTQEWVSYRSEVCPFEASFPAAVNARSLDLSGDEFAHEFHARAGRNNVLIRCTVIDGPAESSDASLLSVGGWDIYDPSIEVEEIYLNGRRALKLAKEKEDEDHNFYIKLHRVFLVAGRYHYRLDFNEREKESGKEDIERFFSSVHIP